MTRFLPRALLAAFAVAAIGTSDAAAQSWLNNLTNPGPQPADNQAVAMREGRQIAGYGGKCLHAEGEIRRGALLVMRDCDANSLNQRFKFEGGNLKTSLRLPNPPNNWSAYCVTSTGQERLAIDLCGGGPGVVTSVIGYKPPVAQQWRINGREIRRGDDVFCFDVYKAWTDNGTPVIYFKCNGDGNQQWSWR